jgi:hypothetical protein
MCVSSGHGTTNRHHGIDTAESPGPDFGSQVDQELFLVSVRAFLVLQGCAFFSPGICHEYKPQRVGVILCHCVCELRIGGNGCDGSFRFLDVVFVEFAENRAIGFFPQLWSASAESFALCSR